MLDDLFEELRDSFKKLDKKNISTNVFQLLTLCSTGYLKDKLRIHPLGFLYCRLHTFSNNETIRIHIWLKELNIPKPLMDIHSHFYKIKSYVVTGAISNTLYHVSRREPFTHASYVGSYGADNKRILKKSEELFHIEETEKQIINERELYEIDKTEIHSGDAVSDKFTISVVFTEEPGNPSPLVLGPIHGLPQYIYSSAIIENIGIIEEKIGGLVSNNQ